MNIIKGKKINSALVKFLLYLSFCFAGWYYARSRLAAVFDMMPMDGTVYNEFTAFFISGLLPFVIYLLITKFFGNFLRQTPFLPVDQMLYALPYFYIGANLVSGLFGILYYFVPIASVWGNIIIPLVSTACFFIWFLAFICKNYVKNYNWKAIILYFGRIYLIVAVLITVLGLIAEVIR